MESNTHTSDPIGDGLGEGTPLLRQFGDRYDSVFVALHPFNDARGVTKGAEELLRQSNLAGPPNPTPYELASLVLHFCRRKLIDFEAVSKLWKSNDARVSWKTICSDLDFRDAATLVRALYPRAASEIEPGYRNQIRLAQYCETHGYFPPFEETHFDTSIQKQLVQLWRRIGINAITAFCGLGEHIVNISIDRLDSPDDWRSVLPDSWYLAKIQSADRSIAAIHEFDAAYTYVFGAREILEAAAISQIMEGFWCTEDMRPRWWKEGTEGTPPIA